MIKRRQFSSLTALAAVTAGLPVMSKFVHAQGQGGVSARARGPNGYPDKTIKIVVPYPAGGIVDVVIRAVTDSLSNELPQRLVTENRAGADGRIGVDLVAKAAADGYTLLACTPLIATGEHLMPEMKGRSRDFAGICVIASAPTVFVVSSGIAATSLKEFVSLAASKPGELNAPNPGTGSSMHLAQELFFEKTDIKLTSVNYKGQPPSLIDMGQGLIQFGLVSQSLALPLIQTGRIRALAVNAAKRTRMLPDVPTVAEAGFSDLLVQSWYGVAAPVQSPAAIVAYLSQEFQRTLKLPEVRKKLEALDVEILAQDGVHLDQLIKSDYTRWGDLIRKRGIKLS